MSTIAPGQVYRDTYYDGAMPSNTKRTVRIVRQDPDGRWLAETVTNTDGTPANGRKTKLKAATLASGYELVQPV